MPSEEKTRLQGDADPSLDLPAAVIEQAEAAASNTTTKPPHAVRDTARRRTVDPPKDSPRDLGQDAPVRQPTEAPIEEEPPPVFGNAYGQVDFNQDGFNTRAKVSNDGRVNIKINQRSRRLSDLLAPALRSQLNLQTVDEPEGALPPTSLPPYLGGKADGPAPPPMNIVIHVVGSRGDVQPFVALGKTLKETHGHRVRLATHPTFKNFVEENGLEFFSIGGDPAELMAFMVKNPGLMPGMDSLRSGDVGKRRKGIYEILQGCWRSCIEVGDGSGPSASDDSLDSRISLDSGIGMNTDLSVKPFIADAIIANPPSFAHVHCAEKLGIPLHMMFTMPWSPTQSFPHPLANIQASNADDSITNFVSYALVEMMTWQGLGDLINRFREKTLGLEEVSLMWAPGMASRLRIPYTYCWSPALIPKPKDWGPHISISGFYFLSLANNYTPAPDLDAFLAAGPPPVYIGFGSIVVDDPNAMTKLIFDAVRKTGQRALVSKGWGGFGADTLGIPEGVFMLGNVPHDWLFKRVSCVVHHGGAGTTAAGIALGKPTVVVPFFGDQPFWGAMVARAGAGPSPIPSKTLTSDNLAAAILEALKPTTLERAQQLGARIKSERGSEMGVHSFHENLGVDKLRCALCPNRVAVWRVKRTTIRLSAFAATALYNEHLLDFKDLKLYRPREYDAEDGPWDPITGGASALIGTISSLMMGVADFPVEILKALKPRNTDELQSTDEASGSEKSKSVNASKTSLDGKPTTAAEGTAAATGAVNRSSEPVTPSGEDDLVRQLQQQTPSGQTSPTNELGPATPTALSPVTSKKSTKGCPATTAMASVFRHHSTSSRPSSRSSSPARHNTAPSAAATSSGGSTTGTTTNSGTGTEASTGTGSSHQRTNSGLPSGPSQIPLEAALGASKSVGRIVGVGLKSPMDFTLSLARGFHNAPKLYGDESVRQNDKITGIQSGLKVAGKEFGYGFYDGISGLLTQPMDGAKKEGVAGLIKGIGKGMGGLILKPSAAIWGLPGYTFKGIYKQIQAHLGSSVQNYIVAARTAQGYEDWHKSTVAERGEVVVAWQRRQADLLREKEHLRQGGSFHQGHGVGSHGGGHGGGGHGGSSHGPEGGFMKTRHMSFDERKKLAKERKEKEKLERQQKATAGAGPGAAGTGPAQLQRGGGAHVRETSKSHSRPRFASLHPSYRKDGADFERAIQASVAATSKGNADEDLLIEKAIRASVAELQAAEKEGDDDKDAVQRAIRASVAEASRARQQRRKVGQAAGGTGGGGGSSSGTTTTTAVVVEEPDAEEAEHDRELEAALERSVTQEQPRHPLAEVDFDDSGPDTDDDCDDNDDDGEEGDGGDDEDAEELRQAMHLSKLTSAAVDDAQEDDADLREAIRLSQQAHAADQEKLDRSKTEEEIVLEYVKRQSLAETQFKQEAIAAAAAGAKTKTTTTATGIDKGASSRVVVEEAPPTQKS